MDKTMMGQATKALEGKADKKSKGKLRMTVHQLDDKKFFVRHEMMGGDGSEMPTEHAPASIKDLHKHIDEHFGGKATQSEHASDWEKERSDREAEPRGVKKD